ncbi:MAG TPA: hypothetical protein VJI15_02335 [Candidatus Nanoarchaeia archaeon]|nr:hypothetical protein [Candidatus Nanoarchaeia archaeon]
MAIPLFPETSIGLLELVDRGFEIGRPRHLGITMVRGPKDHLRSSELGSIDVYAVRFDYALLVSGEISCILSARDPDVTGVVAYSRRHDPHFRNPSLQRYNEEVGERLADCALDHWLERSRGDAANTNVEGVFGVHVYSRLSRGRMALVLLADSDERKDRIVSPSEVQYRVLSGR